MWKTGKRLRAPRAEAYTGGVEKKGAVSTGVWEGEKASTAVHTHSTKLLWKVCVSNFLVTLRSGAIPLRVYPPRFLKSDRSHVVL